MKKIPLIFLALLTLLSCGDEVEFSTPGFQANKNYNRWRATYFTANIDANGSLIIVAGNNNEEMRISVPEMSTDTLDLSTISPSKIEFTDFNDIGYSTSNSPDPSVSLYPEIGKLFFEESAPGTVSGEFKFLAFSEDGMHSVGFNEGVFYRIPIGGGNTSGGTTNCQTATANMATASANFAEVMPGETEYPTYCNAYKTALQQMITACGDESGSLQIMLNNVGDCN